MKGNRYMKLKKVFRFDRSANWSLTRFGLSRLDDYAQELMVQEIRAGVKLLSLIFILQLSAATILNSVLGLGQEDLYTYLLLALLATHIHFATRSVRDVKSLYLLGMTLLVVSSTALVLQAHQAGTLTATTYMGVVLLFVIIPLVPWGVREALLILTLIYLVMTLSTAFGGNRFGNQTLLLLQFFMLSTGLIVLVMVWRSASLRKKEIRAMFELNEAHAEMRQLSYRDPLTGAWNRRYLDENYRAEVERHRQTGQPFYFLIFDVNRFKQINDTFGHPQGDLMLKWVVDAFASNRRAGDILVRMGGDEFALLTDQNPRNQLDKALAALHQRQGEAGWQREYYVTLSCGMVRVAPQEAEIPFNAVYNGADKLLFAAKSRNRRRGDEQKITPADLNFAEMPATCALQGGEN